jgi:hypothetical protein
MDSSSTADQLSGVIRPAYSMTCVLVQRNAPSHLSLQAGLAEMMLVNRLRAHTRSDLALDTLQRGVDVIALTAKNWFAEKVRVRDGHLHTSPLPIVV